MVPSEKEILDKRFKRMVINVFKEMRKDMNKLLNKLQENISS